MEAVQRRSTSDSLKRFLSTRRGAWTVAAISATLGGLVLLVFLNQYKSSVNDGLDSQPVLTADRLIPAGTSGNVVVTDKLFKPTAVAAQDAKLGSVADAQALVGKVAARDILPGQQITAADFSATADGIRSRLVKDLRAVQVPLDGSHGLLGTIRRGDRVDVLVSFNGSKDMSAAGAIGGGGQASVRYLMRDIRVVSAPPAGAAATSGSVILQVTDKQAVQLAYAADNAKLWFALRPPVGATESKAPSVSASSIVLGNKPVKVTADYKRTADGGRVTVTAGEGTP
jgi:Flp pilus assembly protein CpaB